MELTETGPGGILALTAQIVAAHVSKNAVAAGDVPGFIKSVHSSLAALGNPETKTDQHPAVPIKKSVTPEYLVCLEDGKKLKMLKRYLRSQYGLTPDDYRRKWGLPPDYPMTAPGYSNKRSEWAKAAGLGTSPKKRGA